MKKLVPFSPVILLLIFISCGTVSKTNMKPLREVPFNQRPVIAVIDFQNKTGDTGYNNLMENITGSMISELQGTGHFRIIERERLNALLGEMKLSLSGLVNPDKAKEVGKVLGVDALLFGNLSSVQYSKNKQSIFIAWTEGQKVEINMDARLVNVETGEVLAASKASSSVKQRNWVLFWFARLGAKTDKGAIIQSGIDLDLKQLANGIADKTPLRKDFVN